MAILSTDADRTLGHLCGFYQTDAELVSCLTRVVCPWLETGRTVLYIPDAQTSEAAWGRMAQTGLDLSAYRSSGKLRVLLPEESVAGGTASAMFDFLRQAMEAAPQQGGGLGVLCETSWMLSYGLAEAEIGEYEARVNSLSPRVDCSLLCLYDQRRFQAETLLEALTTHPQVVRGGNILPNPHYLPPAEYFSPQRKSLEFGRRLQQLDTQCGGSAFFAEADVKDLLHRLPLLIHAHDATGKYIFWNKESERVLGYSEAEVLQDTGIRSRLFPDADKLTRLNTAAFSEELLCPASDVEYRAKDGTSRVVEFRKRISLPSVSGWDKLNVDAGMDVTDCRNAQAALDASRRQLNLIIENVPARFCLVDSSLRFCFVNARYAAWYGRRPEDIIGAPVRDVLSKNYFEKLFPHMKRALAGESLEFETSADPACGRGKAVRVHYIPNRQADSSIAGFVVMLLDISDQKKAEQALQESELRFRTYLEEAADALFLFEPGGRIREVNRRATEYLGYSHEELRGMALADLDAGMKNKQERKALEQRLLADKRLRTENTLRRKDGALLPVETHWALFEFKGDVFILGQARDISERLRSRAEREELLTRFRVIFEHSIDGILVVTEQSLRVTYANPAISAMLGYTTGDFHSLRFIDFFDQKSLLQSLSGETDPVAFMVAPRSDVCFVKKDGTVFYADTTGARATIDGRESVVFFVRDATKRRADEERLRRSVAFQAKLFEVSPDLIFRLDPSARIQQISPRCKELLGVPDPESMIGTHIKTWVEPQCHDLAQRNFEHITALSPGELLPPNLYRMRRQDGSSFYASFHSAPWHTEQGELDSIVTVVRDVTEEVEAAEELMRSLEFQTRILEASPDAIIRLDREAMVEFISSQPGGMLGDFDPGTFIGTHAREWIDPADHERLEVNIRRILQAENRSLRTSNEYRFQLKNGHTFIGAISSAPFVNESGVVTGIVSIIRDVSEQKRMEQELRVREKQQRDLVESLHEGLEVIDCSGRILFVNKKLCELIGYSKEELLGKRFVDLVPRKDRRRFLAQVIKRKISTVQRYELVFPRKDGVERNFMVTHHPRTDESGNISGSFGVVSDITEEKQLAQRKEEVDRMIRNELRAPLKGILSLTHLMLLDKSGSRCVDYATELNGIADKMLRLIDLSREIFQMEQGEYEPNFGWFDFRKVFRNINRFINPQAEINLVRVIYHNDPESGLGKLQHYGEQVLLESMLITLIKNAVDASQNQDEVTVIFECTQQEMQISVHDYGYLSKDVLLRFFDKYSSYGKVNSGLGRYSAKLIAEAHGGHITVESDKDKGTLVSVTLPRLSPDTGSDTGCV